MTLVFRRGRIGRRGRRFVEDPVQWALERRVVRMDFVEQ